MNKCTWILLYTHVLHTHTGWWHVDGSIRMEYTDDRLEAVRSDAYLWRQVPIVPDTLTFSGAGASPQISGENIPLRCISTFILQLVFH